MTRKGDFVLRQIADEYVLIPYGATAEKMNQVLTLSEQQLLFTSRPAMPYLQKRLQNGSEKLTICRWRKCRRT